MPPDTATADHEIPAFLRTIVVPGEPASATEVATRNAIELDNAMLGIYDQALATYQANLLASAPIILALFTNTGGNFILYRPGEPPLVAPQVPAAYQIVKGISHSSMAVYQLVAPYLGTRNDQSWRAPMRVYREQQQAAFEGIGDLDLPDDARQAITGILEANLTFMDECLSKDGFSLEGIEVFGRSLKPFLGTTIGYAAATQVGHWMGVLDEWQQLIGADWDKTYGVTNTLYVTRTNNIFFTMMAQYFGREAINDRLLLLETTEFQTDPETMLNLLARIVSDRALGQVFFKDYFLMDVELVSTGSRDAITAELAKRTTASGGTYTIPSARDAVAEEANKRGIAPLLPPLAPFHSHEWPWRTSADQGEGASTLDEAFQQE